MRPLRHILDRARAANRHVVLAEGEDRRIQEAARDAVEQGLARITLLGDPAVILPALGEFGDRITVIDPATSPDLSRYAAHYLDKRRHKGITAAQAIDAAQQPLTFAALMVACGDADGTVAGAVATTADTVRAALTVIGKAPGVETVSSFFLMLACESFHQQPGGMIFADCGLVIDPTAPELAAIAQSSARSAQSLLGETPQVALLSFSTVGSAEHPRVEKVREALTLLRQQAPDLTVDGELQFDAAFESAVRKAKAPDSRLIDRPNVFVFPNLDAGNIGYKIAQRIGQLQAIGPVLQGLAHPANDLSRGCTAEDVLGMIAVTAVQAEDAAEQRKTAEKFHCNSDGHVAE